MGLLLKIIKLTKALYQTLAGGGTVGSLTGINDNYLYFITDETVSSSDLGDDFLLPVSKGGTGKDRFTVGSVLVGNGLNALTELAATSLNTGNTIVLRNADGNFSAGTITANLTGKATTAGVADSANAVAWGNVGNRPTSIALDGAVTANATTLGNGAISITTTVNHGHGNINTSGQIGQTSNWALANGNGLVVFDSNNSNKIERSGITFDASTESQVLSKKGTWVDMYSHPTGDGNKHVPATGTTNNGKILKAGSTAGSISWGTLNASDVGALASDTVVNKVKLTVKSDNIEYKVLGSAGGASPTSGSNYEAIYDTNITINPSTSTISATNFNGVTMTLSKYMHTIVTGSGTAAVTSGTKMPALWKFDLGITSPTEGDIITIKIPVAGHANGVFVSLDNGTTYYPVSVSGTGLLTTHYTKDQIITLVCVGSGGTNGIYPALLTINGKTYTLGTSTNVTGKHWCVVNYYDSGNTNTLLRTFRSSTNIELPIAGINASNSATATYNTSSSISSGSYASMYGAIPNDTTKLATINPSTGAITVPGGITADITGDVTGNADTATKLAASKTIWGQNFDGSANVTGNMTNVGPSLKLPADAGTDFYFLKSDSKAADGYFGKLALNTTYANADLTNYVLDVLGAVRIKLPNSSTISSRKFIITRGNDNINLSIGVSGILAYDNTTTSLLYLQYYGGNLQIGTADTASATRDLYGKFDFKSTSGFKFSGIETTTSSSYNVARPIWFSTAASTSSVTNGTPILDTNFTYNPSTHNLNFAANATITASAGKTLGVNTTTSKLTLSATTGSIELSTTTGALDIKTTSTGIITLSSGNTLYLNKPTSASIIFTSGGASTTYEKGRFNTNGNLQLDNSNSAGTQNTHKFYVKGDSAFEGKIAFATAASDVITNEAYMQWNATDLSIDFIFA